MKTPMVAVIGVVATLFLVGCNPEFSAVDIVNVEEEIKVEMEDRIIKSVGFINPHVEIKVELIKVSNKKLEGVANLKFPTGELSTGKLSFKTVTFPCSATMAESDSSYIWQCN